MPMARAQYAEIQADDQKEARDRERIALSRSIDLMEIAAMESASSTDIAMAITFSRKLWTVLVEDLAAPANGLPKELRAQLISIGIWVLRELESIRAEPGKGFGDAIAVSKAIRDGLL